MKKLLLVLCVLTGQTIYSAAAGKNEENSYLFAIGLHVTQTMQEPERNFLLYAIQNNRPEGKIKELFDQCISQHNYPAIAQARVHGRRQKGQEQLNELIGKLKKKEAQKINDYIDALRSEGKN